MILDIVIFIAVLVLLVLVHEFGHFLAAKKFKMFVEEFGFGFPPRIKGWRKGETLWSINAVPLGGFVKIAGEEGDDEKKEFIATEKITSQEETVEIIDTPTKEVIIEEKTTVIDKAAEIPRDRLFSSRPLWQRIVVLISGVIMNLILGWLILVVVFSFGTKPVVIVSQVSSDSPAYQAGIKAGDEIIGFSTADQFVEYVNQHKGQQITLDVKLDQDTKQITVTPRKVVPQGEGPLGVGISSGGIEKEPFLKAFWDATKAAGELFALIFVLVIKMIVGIFRGENLFQYVSGPVGIFQATSQAAGLGIGYLANLVALISINLAAINIFPFPALDGGRVLFLIIEKIKGSPIKTSTQRLVNSIGFGLLILLVIAASVQDVTRIFHH